MHRPIDILLVEDSATDLHLCLLALRENNLANHVQIARDGQEALDFLFGSAHQAGSIAEPIPKLILLDLKLPRVDGLEVLKRIRKDPRTQMVPVVMMTSSREERDLLESYRLGVSSYIVKPVNFEQLCKAVQNLGFYWLIVNTIPSSE